MLLFGCWLLLLLLLQFWWENQTHPPTNWFCLEQSCFTFPPLSSAMIGKMDVSCFPAETWEGLLWVEDCWKPVCNRDSPAGRPLPTSRSRKDQTGSNKSKLLPLADRRQESPSPTNLSPRGIWMQTCMCEPFRNRGCLSAGVHSSLKNAVINLLCLYLVWFHFVLILLAVFDWSFSKPLPCRWITD